MHLPYLNPKFGYLVLAGYRNKKVALLDVSEIGIPEECLSEMKCKDLTCLLVAARTTKPSERIS